MKKHWYKQKTFWAGAASVLAGAGAIVMGDARGGIELIATGVIGIFLRQGVEGVKAGSE